MMSPATSSGCPSRPRGICAMIFVSSTSLWMAIIFFFNDTATTKIYTLSLHDALPISFDLRASARSHQRRPREDGRHVGRMRSEEHTSELQSQSNLVCRLLLEKKN